MFSSKEQAYILSLARRSIEHYFDSGENLRVSENELPTEQLKEKRVCFVTLTIHGNLRGCIGHIEPVQPLYEDIIENAVSAAFADPRFMPLSKEEFARVNLEVSILTVPTALDSADADDLLKKLRPNIDGVILRRGGFGATYLPQVWEDLPDKKEFLTSLCQKAGLPPDDWMKPGMKVMVYQAAVVK